MKHRFLYCLALLIGIFTSCEDIFERDLAKKEEVRVLAPPNHFETTQNAITFWWHDVRGADYYLLQIVDSTFAFINEVILDTTVTTNKFTYVFSKPGQYRWRVRAENNSSFTEYVTRNLRIDSTTDLEDVTILLLQPKNDLASSAKTHTFTWEPHPFATHYKFEVAQPDFSDNGNILDVLTVLADSTNYTFTDDGSYEWRVKGENGNNNSSSAYSTRTITIDTQAPGAPQLSAPAHKDTVSFPVTLSWTPDQASDFDSLIVYEDSASNIIVSLELTETSYEFTHDTPTDSIYFWRVRSIDAAGNAGSFSTLRKFIVKE